MARGLLSGPEIGRRGSAKTGSGSGTIDSPPGDPRGIGAVDVAIGVVDDGFGNAARDFERCILRISSFKLGGRSRPGAGRVNEAKIPF